MQPGRGEVEVHEPGPGDLGPGDMGRRVGGEDLDDLARELAGVPLRVLGGREGDVGGPVPVHAPGRPLERDGVGRGHADLVEGTAQGRFEHVADHGHRSPVGRWGTSVGRLWGTMGSVDATDVRVLPRTGFGRRRWGRYPVPSRPRSSGDRASASGAVCAGSNPAEGAASICAVTRALSWSPPRPRVTASDAGFAPFSSILREEHGKDSGAESRSAPGSSPAWRR